MNQNELPRACPPMLCVCEYVCVCAPTCTHVELTPQACVRTRVQTCSNSQFGHPLTPTPHIVFNIRNLKVKIINPPSPIVYTLTAPTVTPA